MEKQIVGWFEIPVMDMDRAVKFYNEVFDIQINVQQFGLTTMGWFPSTNDRMAPGSGGSLIYNPEHYKPSDQGTLVYFNCDNLSAELSRIDTAGGEVLRKKTQISPEIGHMALFKDTEGNRVALYSKE